MKVSEMSGEVLAKHAMRASPCMRWTGHNPVPHESFEDALTLALHHGLFIQADGPLVQRRWKVGYANTHNAWNALWRYQDYVGDEKTDVNDGEGNSAMPRLHTDQFSADVREAVCRCVVANVLGQEV